MSTRDATCLGGKTALAIGIFTAAISCVDVRANDAPAPTPPRRIGGAFVVPVERTPYDSQIDRVRDVLFAEAPACSSGTGAEQRLSDLGGRSGALAAINQIIEALRAMPYEYTDTWQRPEEVLAPNASADCKGKSVALYAQLKRLGLNDVYLVIGTRTMASPTPHAWVVWGPGDDFYILDPTYNYMAIPRQMLSGPIYEGDYAYGEARRFSRLYRIWQSRPGFNTNEP